MTFYIAGKMSGLPDLGRAKFNAAARFLRSKGHIVLNPAELPDGMPREKYLPICLAMVSAADAVLALSDWEYSEGAKVEVRFARYQGKQLFLFENERDVF